MASVYGMNDGTHLGFFDIPMLTSILHKSQVTRHGEGIAKELHDRYDATELLRDNGVSLEQIVADAKQILSV